ncbi:MAG TPA: sulfurtransferase TusA family protein [Trueperaceae bacterium]|nr:sulfurtransferase TusA family protein [Trueperaceae bacterium]
MTTADVAAQREPSGASPASVGRTAPAGGALHRLDNRGTSCAIGLIRIQERLAAMPLGDTLEVVTRDRFAPYEVPIWVERHGLELTSQERRGFWLLASTTFRIRKTAEVPPPRA